jgi:hypothetical protein
MTLPVAGWYDDPADAQRLRWWTGTEWSDATEHRRPEPPAAASVAETPHVEPATEPAAAAHAEPIAAVPVAEPIAAEPVAAEPAALQPLPYGPASLTAGYAATAAVTSAAGPPPLPPFAQDALSGGTPNLPTAPPAPARPSATTAAPAVAAPTPYPAPAPSSFAQLRRGNPLAFTGVLVGLAAFVFNPFGGPGLLALIFGIMGMVRASALKRRGAAVTGVGWAVVALALAAIVVLRGFVNLFGMAV